MLRPVPYVFFYVAGEGVGIVRQEEMRVIDDVAISGVLERLRPAADEVEEVGGRVDPHVLIRDVGIEPQDQSFVLAGLHAWMLRERPASIRRPDEVGHVRLVGFAPGFQFEDEAVVAGAVVACEQDIHPRSTGGGDVVFDGHLHVVVDIGPPQRD